MEGNSLFNPGFLGGNFNWWVGQIPDDSYWRENIIPYVHEEASESFGWGYRYKVRILGLHEWGEQSISSDDLPWAQVMYPVTAGGGQGSSGATSSIRQGNMVFGFFMDQGDQQIPIIMGILGNDMQPKLSYTQGDDKVTNEKAGSILTAGDAERKVPHVGNTRSDPGDSNRSAQKQESGNKTDNSNTGVHVTTVTDTKRLTDQKIKHVMLSPCNPNQSALKGIQTALDNLMNYIDGWLSTITSYVDAAAAIINSLKDMESMLERIACEIGKYLKMIMDNVMQYVLKLLNKSLAPAVAAIPSTMRSMFGDMKEIITQLILCLYNKLTAGMCDMLAGLLKSAFDLGGLEKKAKEQALNADPDDRTHPEVPMCYAEDLVSKVLAANKQEIDDANQSIIDKLDVFVSDIQEEMAGLTGAFADIQSMIGDITGGISAALGFSNISLNIFGCELSPSCAMSDYYTIGQGGSAQADSQEPSKESVAEGANDPPSGEGATPQTPNMEPTPGTPPQDLSALRAETAANEARPENQVGAQVTGSDLDEVLAEQAMGQGAQEATDSLDMY